MRLNKYLAASGTASRRKSDELILEGKVLINGKKALIGAVINPRVDEVTIEGERITLEEKVYYIFNKPLNVLTTLLDPFLRPTIKDFIHSIPLRVFPVGRLDFDSHGLLLLTNDGNLAHKVQHPKYEVNKVYRVLVDSLLSEEQENMFKTGIILEEGKTSACGLKKIGMNQYEVTLHQGWNRQIRRMFEFFNSNVLDLKRIKIGDLTVDGLKEGSFRELTKEEEEALKSKFI